MNDMKCNASSSEAMENEYEMNKKVSRCHFPCGLAKFFLSTDGKIEVFP